MIRAATVPGDHPGKDAELSAAEAELRAVVDDPAAAALHRSALGLIDFVGARIRPVQQLHVFARKLNANLDVTEQDFDNYRWTLAHLPNDAGEVAADRSRARRRPVRLDPEHAGRRRGRAGAVAGDQVDAVARGCAVAAAWAARFGRCAARRRALADRRSAAYPTVAFLRVRLLARLDRADEARAALAMLPRSAQPPFDAEAVNLLRAERLMLATTIDEFLRNAGRDVFGRCNWPAGRCSAPMPPCR